MADHPDVASGSTDEFEALLAYLRDTRGFDFTGYKRASLVRRSMKRITELGLEGYDQYEDYLEVHPDEFPILFDTLLINVTEFFRDTEAWEYLRKEVLPAIVEGDAPIRVWSAGCASGQEPASIAIMLAGMLGDEQFGRRVKIYATDIDEDALLTARQASYLAKDLESLDEDMRARYFALHGSRYVLRPDLRRSIIYGRHDLVVDAPISRLDLVLCRNTLMYLNAETQTKVLNHLHFALKDGGSVFLGRAEMLLTHTDLFAPIELKHRIFKKVGKKARVAAAPERHLEEWEVGNPALTAALAASPQAQIIVDADKRVVAISNRARSLFGVGQRDLGRPLKDLEISFRPVELRGPIQQAESEGHALVLAEVEMNRTGAENLCLIVHVIPMVGQAGESLGTLVLFEDVTRHRQLSRDLIRSNQELETASEELQSMNEELETTNEELQSTVEELETTNEELQSTNEEMETLNEELQSTNAELQALNDELRVRTMNLDVVNVLSESVIASIHGAVVVLDRDLKVERWSSKAEDLWGLREDETLGIGFAKLDFGLPVGLLTTTLREGLAGRPAELVVDATNRRGKTFRCHVTSTPLVDSAGDVSGVVLLLEDVEATSSRE